MSAHLSEELPGSAAGTIILVVEDDVLVRAMISDELRDRGHTVIEAANADEALAILSSPVRMDIVVTDMQMPGSIDGSELVRTIRGQWPHAAKHVDLTYRGFPGELTHNYMRYEYFTKGGGYAFDYFHWGRGDGGWAEGAVMTGGMAPGGAPPPMAAAPGFG